MSSVLDASQSSGGEADLSPPRVEENPGSENGLSLPPWKRENSPLPLIPTERDNAVVSPVSGSWRFDSQAVGERRNFRSASMADLREGPITIGTKSLSPTSAEAPTLSQHAFPPRIQPIPLPRSHPRGEKPVSQQRLPPRPERSDLPSKSKISSLPSIPIPKAFGISQSARGPPSWKSAPRTIPVGPLAVRLAAPVSATPSSPRLQMGRRGILLLF